MAEYSELIDAMDKMIDLELKKIETLRELKKAYMLGSIIGMPPNKIKGDLTTSIHSDGHRPKSWLRDEFVVCLDGKEMARKKLIDVPLDLWPERDRALYKRNTWRAP